MFFTRENKQTQTKNDTSNQNRVRLFFTRERNDASDKKPQRCVSFAPKFPPFIQHCLKALVACSASVSKLLLRRYSRRKDFLPDFFSYEIEEHLENWSQRKGQKTED